MDDPPSKENVLDMLLKSFNRVYNGNRAPFGLYMHAGWFFAPNTWHYDGYKDFVKVKIFHSSFELVTYHKND
jgi:hypothetical protein